MIDPSSNNLEAARRGDTEAAGRLVGEFHARVYAFLRRLSGSDADAVELTQRAFCRAWASLAGFAGRSSVSSWLHGIAYRTYVDWLRAERRNIALPDEWWLALPDPSRGPDLVVADADAGAAVYAAVDRLESTLRETVHLHYYQGLTLEETASALEIATSTVKYRIRQALAELQRSLAPGQSCLNGTSPSPANNRRTTESR